MEPERDAPWSMQSPNRAVLVAALVDARHLDARGVVDRGELLARNVAPPACGTAGARTSASFRWPPDLLPAAQACERTLAALDGQAGEPVSPEHAVHAVARGADAVRALKVPGDAHRTGVARANAGE